MNNKRGEVIASRNNKNKCIQTKGYVSYPQLSADMYRKCSFQDKFSFLYDVMMRLVLGLYVQNIIKNNLRPKLNYKIVY